MQGTSIQWADATWNPITGCTPISLGCQNCYARRMARRLAGRFGYPADDPFRVTFHLDRLVQPLQRRKPARVFVCSMGDLFHPDVKYSWINAIFAVMAICREQEFLVLTKRPENALNWFRALGQGFSVLSFLEFNLWHYFLAPLSLQSDIHRSLRTVDWPLANVWLGVTGESQDLVKIRLQYLLQIPAFVHFVSCEPLLTEISLTEISLPANTFASPWEIRLPLRGLDWVIAGGETGPGARPMSASWVRSLRDECQAFQVPFFFKHWGGKKTNGRVLDGRTWDQFPQSALS